LSENFAKTLHGLVKPHQPMGKKFNNFSVNKSHYASNYLTFITNDYRATPNIR